MAEPVVPEPATHRCPYDGYVVELRDSHDRETAYESDPGPVTARDCGEAGHLCHRCREDRADARAGSVARAVDNVAWHLDRIVNELGSSSDAADC